MRRRRSFRRRATWEWAKSFKLQVNDTGGAGSTVFGSIQLLPSNRVRFLNELARRKALTIQRTLMWMDLKLLPSGDVGSHSVFPEFVDMYIIKQTQDLDPDTAVDFHPFSEPEVPSALTNWDANITPDGLDPFMWCHRHFFRSAQGLIFPDTTAPITPAQNNTWVEGVQTTPLSAIDSAMYVRPDWAPSLDLRVRRAMKNDESLYLGLSFPSAGNTQWSVQLFAALRMLCK